MVGIPNQPDVLSDVLVLAPAQEQLQQVVKAAVLTSTVWCLASVPMSLKGFEERFCSADKHGGAERTITPLTRFPETRRAPGLPRIP